MNQLTVLHRLSRLPAPSPLAAAVLRASAAASDPRPKHQPARIVVYGVGPASAARDVVSALVDEPFKPASPYGTSIRARWHSPAAAQQLIFSYADTLAVEPPFLRLPSPLLCHAESPVQLVELATHTPSESTLLALHTADIPIIVWNPLTTPIQALDLGLFPLTNPNLVLAITATPPTPDTPLFPNPAPGHHIVYLNPSRALRAIDLLRSDPSPRSVQMFQDASTESGISTLKSILQSALRTGPQLQSQTLFSQIRGVLAAHRASIDSDKRQLNILASDITLLRDAIDETQASAQHILLKPSMKNPTMHHTEDNVASALRSSEQNLRTAMAPLTLWRVLWRVDDIGDMISDAVKSAWCIDLEKLLVYHTGKLSASQQQFEEAAFTLLSKHPGVSCSNLLRNKLSQITVSPAYPLIPNTFLAPLKSRQSQILEHPTPRLHQAAQKAVLRISGGMAAGAGFSWAGWFGWLAATQGSFLSFMAIDSATSLGTGALIAVSSLWWAGFKWDRAKAQWWDDWNRIGQGLDRDLKDALGRAVQDKVVVIASTACDELEELSLRRRRELEASEEELERLQVEVDTKVDSTRQE